MTQAHLMSIIIKVLMTDFSKFPTKAAPSMLDALDINTTRHAKKKTCGH